MAPTTLIKASPESGTVIHPVYSYTEEQQQKIEDLKKVCATEDHSGNAPYSSIISRYLSIPPALLYPLQIRTTNGSSGGLHEQIPTLDI